MPKIAIAALLSAALSAGCVDTFDGDGVPGEEVRVAQDFDLLSARGDLDVAVTQGPFAVSVKIDQNLLERVITTVDQGRLEISIDGGNLGEHLPGPNVIVSMPALRDVELNGSGRIAAGEFDEDEAVSVELSGAGEVSWSGDAPSLDALLNGNGELTLSGSATTVTYHLVGAGTLDAKALTARGAGIEVQGSGKVTATVDGRVDATVEGTGTIDLLGNVIQGVWEVSEEGDVTGP